jgi:PilZ domain
VQVRVPVMISGKHPDGSHFRKGGHIVTVSKYGAKLRTPQPLTVGTELKVKPERGRQAGLFRVVWVGREGTPRSGEIGIEYVQVSNLLGVTFPE